MRRKANILMFILLISVPVASAEVLSAEIKCQECDIKIVSGWHELRPNAGEKIILTAYSSGGVGNINYLWTKNNQQICDSVSCSIIVLEEMEEYLLIVSDDLGSVNIWIRIIPKLPQKCLPKFKSDIDLDDKIGRKEWSAGDTFIIEARLDKSDCSNSDYKFYWKSDNSGIVFSSPYSTKTEVRIKEGAKIGNVTIEAVLSNDFQERKKKIIIKVVDNTPPEIVSIKYDEPLSYIRFNVYVDAESGKSGNENNDFIQCLVVLKNEQGKIVDKSSKTIKSGDFNFAFGLRPEGWGIYSIEATLKDSHDLSSPVVTETFKVEKGNTGKDIPVIFVSDIIYCVQGEECKINAIGTWIKDGSVSTFGYYENGKELLDKNGDICSGSIGKFVFGYPGTHKIKITAKYFGSDKIGSKIINVIVANNESATPTPAPTQKQIMAPQPTELPYRRYEPTSTPGVGAGTVIITIMLAIIFRRRKK